MRMVFLIYHGDEDLIYNGALERFVCLMGLGGDSQDSVNVVCEGGHRHFVDANPETILDMAQVEEFVSIRKRECQR